MTRRGANDEAATQRSTTDGVDVGRRERSAATQHRPRWLPSGRSLVGGVLVASAAAGVLVAHQAATTPASTRFVVATRDLPAGSALESADLGTVAAQLPRESTAVAESDAEELIGRVLRVPVRSMDLLRSSDVVEAERFTSPAAVEVALDLPPAQALVGTVRQGDRVDVLSTDPDGPATVAVARGAVVTGAADEDPSGEIGGVGSVRVRLALADDETAAAVVDAAVRTELWLVLPAPGRDEGADR